MFKNYIKYIEKYALLQLPTLVIINNEYCISYDFKYVLEYVIYKICIPF